MTSNSWRSATAPGGSGRRGSAPRPSRRGRRARGCGARRASSASARARRSAGDRGRRPWSAPAPVCASSSPVRVELRARAGRPTRRATRGRSETDDLQRRASVHGCIERLPVSLRFRREGLSGGRAGSVYRMSSVWPGRRGQTSRAREGGPQRPRVARLVRGPSGRHSPPRARARSLDRRRRGLRSTSAPLRAFADVKVRDVQEACSRGEALGSSSNQGGQPFQDLQRPALSAFEDGAARCRKASAAEPLTMGRGGGGRARLRNDFPAHVAKQQTLQHAFAVGTFPLSACRLSGLRSLSRWRKASASQLEADQESRAEPAEATAIRFAGMRRKPARHP